MTFPRPGLWRRAGRWYLQRWPGLPGQSHLAGALDRSFRTDPVTAIARTRFGSTVPVTTTDLSSGTYTCSESGSRT